MNRRHLVLLLMGIFVASSIDYDVEPGTPIVLASRQESRSLLPLFAPTPTATLENELQERAEQLKTESNELAQLGDTQGALKNMSKPSTSVATLMTVMDKREHSITWDWCILQKSILNKPIMKLRWTIFSKRAPSGMIWPIHVGRLRSLQYSWVYAKLGKTRQAITHFDQAVPLSADFDEPTEYGSALVNIAAGYEALGDDEHAITYAGYL